VAGDAALQAKFAAIMKEAAEAEKATQGRLAAFAKEAGYEVDLEEAQEFFKALSEQKEGDLSDAELDIVAGGKSKEEEIAISIASQSIACQAKSYKSSPMCFD
jgi:hypothetical protein